MPAQPDSPSSSQLVASLITVLADIVVSAEDCESIEGRWVRDMSTFDSVPRSLEPRIVGRVALVDVFAPASGALLVRAGTHIGTAEARSIAEEGVGEVGIRSPLGCTAAPGVCARCLGWRDGEPVRPGDRVGADAARAIAGLVSGLTIAPVARHASFRLGHIPATPAESPWRSPCDGVLDARPPWPALENGILLEDVRMRVAHQAGEPWCFDDEVQLPAGARLLVAVGGEVMSGDPLAEWDPGVRRVLARSAATVDLGDMRLARRRDGSVVVLDRFAFLRLDAKPGSPPAERVRLSAGARLLVADGAAVERGDVLAEWDPRCPGLIVAAADGVVRLENVQPGLTARRDIDPGSGRPCWRLVDTVFAAERPAVLLAPNGREGVGELVRYDLADGILLVDDGARVEAGDPLWHYEDLPSLELPGPHERLVELLCARVAPDAAVLAPLDGEVVLEKSTDGTRRAGVVPEIGTPIMSELAANLRLIVRRGERVRAGEPLTAGRVSPVAILEILGQHACATFFLDEIQDLLEYLAAGPEVSEVHFELLLREMLGYGRVEDRGATAFEPQSLVPLSVLEAANKAAVEQGGEFVVATHVMLGVPTLAALRGR